MVNRPKANHPISRASLNCQKCACGVVTRIMRRDSAWGASRKRPTADYQRQTHSEKSHQIAKYDIPEQRRPLESQECSEASCREGDPQPQSDGEPQRDDMKPLALHLQVTFCQLGTKRRRGPPQ